MTRTPLIFLLLFLLPAGTLAQVRSIADAEYWAAVRESNDRIDSLVRRETLKREKVLGSSRELYQEKVSEYLSPNRFKFVRTEISKDGNKHVLELIKFDDSFYCRQSGEKWKKSPSWCGPNEFYGFPADAKKEATLEILGDGKARVKHYRLYATYSYRSEPTKLSFWDSNTWIDVDGRPIRSESRTGELRPGSLVYVTSVKYAYEPLVPPVKITVPVN